jgi:predicted metal-dependent peptidase
MLKYQLPENVKKWLARSVILIDLPEDFPFPGLVRLTPHGYHIGIRKDIQDVELRDTLLAHEIGHILRGDMLVKNVNPLLWNIAADACINSNLNRESIKELGGVNYDHIAEKYDLNPHQAPGAKIIYDLMKEDIENSGSGSMDLHEGMQGDEEECRKAHVQTILEALYDGVVNENAIRSSGKYGNSSNVIAVPKRQPLLEQWLLALRSAKIGGTPTRFKSWVRHGRIPGIKGTARLHRAKVAVLADVSGSVVSLLPNILGAAKALQKVCNVQVMVWATGAEWYTGADSVMKVGGGTQLSSAFRILGQNTFDAVVIITDGELLDSKESSDIAPNCPLIWCLTENAKAPWKRPRDKVIDLI